MQYNMATNPGNNENEDDDDFQIEGEGNAHNADIDVDEPPPAFNPQAVAPSDYASYGSMSSHEQQAQQQYMSQAPPPQYNPQQIQYVNQYGQPVSFSQPSSQQRPQQQLPRQPQSPVVVVPPQYAQQTIIYGQSQQQQQRQDQNQPLVRANGYKPIYDYRHPTGRDKQKRIAAFLVGSLSLILMLIAMSSKELASGKVDGYEIRCGIASLEIKDDYSSTYQTDDAFYADFCWSVDSDVEWTQWENTDSHDWCRTWAAASYWISCLTFAAFMSCLATCWVQPLCTMSRCCCVNACPRFFYAISLLFLILANVLWTVNDRVCMPSDAFGLHIGSSIDLVSGACVVTFAVIICAK